MPSIKRLIPRGDIAARLDRTLQYLRGVPRQRLTRDLAHPERAWAYGADMPGRWLEFVSRATELGIAAAGDLPSTAIVDDLLRYQQADGMLGEKYNSTAWACAGRGLGGLAEAYAAFAYEPALQGARRLVDCFETSLPDVPAHRGCMGLRDLVRYSEVSGDERGLAFARSMRDTCPELAPDYPLEAIEGNLHIFVNVNRGLLRLYGHTGGDDLLEQVIRLRAFLDQRYHWVTGGISEWLHPSDESSPADAGNADAIFSDDERNLTRRRDETCTTADWMMLNLELGRITGEDHYVETAEHTFWNHLLAGQTEAGGWCARRDLSGLGGEVWDVCCTFHGPMGLIGAMEHALQPTADGVRVNLYVPVEAELELDQRPVRVALDFDPLLANASLTFLDMSPDRLTVGLRRPRWAADFGLDAPADKVREETETELQVSGSWEQGDVIHSAATNRVVIHNDRHAHRHAGVVAQRGPLVLAAVDFAGSAEETVRVYREETEAVRRIVVELDGRWSTVVGQYRVESGYVDWDYPEHGLVFQVFVDGQLVMGSKIKQGWMPSQLIGESIAGARKLVLEVSSTHPDFLRETGHFASMRLMNEEGGLAFLEPAFEAGQTPVFRLDMSEDELAELIRNADLTAPLHLDCGQTACTLIPFKDVPKVVRPGIEAGQMIPLSPQEFAVLLPGISLQSEESARAVG